MFSRLTSPKVAERRPLLAKNGKLTRLSRFNVSVTVIHPKQVDFGMTYRREQSIRDGKWYAEPER
jgi:hypothetical protein